MIVHFVRWCVGPQVSYLDDLKRLGRLRVWDSLEHSAFGQVLCSGFSHHVARCRVTIASQSIGIWPTSEQLGAANACYWGDAGGGRRPLRSLVTAGLLSPSRRFSAAADFSTRSLHALGDLSIALLGANAGFQRCKQQSAICLRVVRSEVASVRKQEHGWDGTSRGGKRGGRCKEVIKGGRERARLGGREGRA